MIKLQYCQLLFIYFFFATKGFEIHQLEEVVGVLTPNSLQPGAWKEMLLVFVGIWIPGAADGILFICKQKTSFF